MGMLKCAVISKEFLVSYFYFLLSQTTSATKKKIVAKLKHVRIAMWSNQRSDILKSACQGKIVDSQAKHYSVLLFSSFLRFLF